MGSRRTTHLGLALLLLPRVGPGLLHARVLCLVLHVSAPSLLLMLRSFVLRSLLGRVVEVVDRLPADAPVAVHCDERDAADFLDFAGFGTRSALASRGRHRPIALALAALAGGVATLATAAALAATLAAPLAATLAAAFASSAMRRFRVGHARRR